jgi:hypothetical protein
MLLLLHLQKNPKTLTKRSGISFHLQKEIFNFPPRKYAFPVLKLVVVVVGCCWS